MTSNATIQNRIANTKTQLSHSTFVNYYCNRFAP